MFEIGFWEIVLIGIIALVVLGPERLPQVARTAGLWIGKARGMMRQVKADIDRELAADELKRMMAKHSELNERFEIIDKKPAPPRPPGTQPAEPDQSAEPHQPQAAVAQPAVAENAGNAPDRESSPDTIASTNDARR